LTTQQPPARPNEPVPTSELFQPTKD